MNAKQGDGPPPLIVEGLYSFQIGGSERLGVDLAEAFTRRGYRVITVSFYDGDGPMREVLERMGIPSLGFEYERRGRIGLPLLLVELYRFFRKERPHAVHFQHSLTLNLAGRCARRAGVRRLVMTEHADEPLRLQPRYRRNTARSCTIVDAVTAVHPRLADYFATELSVPRNRLRVIRNGVSIPQSRSQEVRERLRSELGLEPGDFAFMFVGRLHSDKSLPTLLHATAALAARATRPFKVVLVGDGPERAALEALVQELAVDGRVVFAGARNNARELLQAADAFIMTSRSEGLPMALLEAMAHGLPCISTRVGGIPEALEPDCGLLIEPGRPEAAAEAMEQVLTSAPLRERLGIAALERVRSHYNFDAAVDAYLEAMGLPAQWQPA